MDGRTAIHRIGGEDWAIGRDLASSVWRSFAFWLNAGRGEICCELTTAGIAPAAAAHIHTGFDDIAGPVVVPLDAPTNGSSAGCTDVPREKIHAMLVAPWAFYVNVHNADFPGGALRGQLG